MSRARRTRWRSVTERSVHGGANSGRVGLDAKVGLGSNLTLEATVNPDFGQVEADPAEVNLSAFETFFEERRPFFVEGSDLLTATSTIISIPAGSALSLRADGRRRLRRFTRDVDDSRCRKTDWRLESGMSIGMLGAVTDEESARTFTFPSMFGRMRWRLARPMVSPVYSRSSAPPGSTAAVMATAVHRNLAAGRSARVTAHAQRLHPQRRFRPPSGAGTTKCSRTPGTRTSTVKRPPSIGCSGRARATCSDRMRTTSATIRSARR